MSSEESKPVKKSVLEQDDAEDGMSLGSMLHNRKKKPSNVGSNSLSKVKKEEVQGDGVEKPPKANSGSGSKGAKMKKEERFNYADDDIDEKPGKNSAAQRDMGLKKKKKVKEEKCKTSKQEVESKKNERKEKKIFDLPGQKRDPPEERDPLRIFYETLYKQLPHSEMARFWMMESGLLSKEEAKKVYEMKQKRAALQKINSPVKAVSAMKSVTKTVTVKKKASVSPVSSNKKKTMDSKVAAKLSKKRKTEDGSCEEDSDDDFIISRSVKKKPRAA